MARLKQEVTLEVWTEGVGGELILDATGLRIDFDIRDIPGFSKAKFVIYNLSETTVQSLMDGDRYVTLKTRLHDGKQVTLANRFYLSNATDELKLPERITSLFCFDKLKLTLEKKVTVSVEKASLRRMVESACRNTGFSGSLNFDTFPSELEDEAPLNVRPRSLSGTLDSVFKELEKEFNFLTFTGDNSFTFMYMPDKENVDKTSLSDKEPDIVFNTRAMRSNPKIGIANCKIVSNLDGRIKPSVVMDLSQLLTVSADASQDTLELVSGYLKNFSDYSKYQAFAVQHKGSNYTEEWSTIVSGLSPTKGKLASTVTWAQ
tara:strand:- start:3676 stop:4629 length:954 start_codon:yes stop_codon:yes gene_type:complete